MKSRRTICLLASILVLLGQNPLLAQERLSIIKQKDALGFLKPVPVHVSGFTGEADSVLKNDLLFMGVQHVSLEQAQYLVNGSNAGRVEGEVLDKTTKYPTMKRRAYTGGGSTRSHIHALADDVAKVLTELPGIAQTKIAFKAEPGRALSEVYIADYDGFGPIQVTRDNSLVTAPCWAGAGSLVYASYKLGNPYIFSHELGTGTRKAVARYPGDNYSPAVSPDGTRVAMILNKNGNPDLFVSGVDGSGLKQLTTTREAESSPCWSPDGRKICFTSRAGGAAALYTVNASGGRPVPLPITGAPSPTEPDYSPDGKWLAFTTQSRGFTICIAPAQGGDAIPLVSGEDPTWARNSRAIMFCSGPDHGKHLSLLDVPTKQVKHVARILESNSSPSWAK